MALAAASQSKSPSDSLKMAEESKWKPPGEEDEEEEIDETVSGT